MTGFVTRTDLWLLDKVFQRVADFVRNEFGITCFGLARGSLAVALAVSFADTMARSEIVAAALLAVCGIAIYRRILSVEARAREGVANAARYELFAHRLAWVLLLFGDIALLLIAASLCMMFLVAVAYFTSCQLRPREPKFSFVPEGAS